MGGEDLVVLDKLGVDPCCRKGVLSKYLREEATRVHTLSRRYE
jgi:DNA-directed RNA polymerase subunit N (RpoN/RPB10)